MKRVKNAKKKFPMVESKKYPYTEDDLAIAFPGVVPDNVKKVGFFCRKETKVLPNCFTLTMKGLKNA
ncbi:MAG: hypothetical protein Kow0090_05410 [Myxococcota bacterium]